MQLNLSPKTTCLERPYYMASRCGLWRQVPLYKDHILMVPRVVFIIYTGFTVHVPSKYRYSASISWAWYPRFLMLGLNMGRVYDSINTVHALYHAWDSGNCMSTYNPLGYWCQNWDAILRQKIKNTCSLLFGRNLTGSDRNGLCHVSTLHVIVPIKNWIHNVRCRKILENSQVPFCIFQSIKSQDTQANWWWPKRIGHWRGYAQL